MLLYMMMNEKIYNKGRRCWRKFVRLDKFLPNMCTICGGIPCHLDVNRFHVDEKKRFQCVRLYIYATGVSHTVAHCSRERPVEQSIVCCRANARAYGGRGVTSQRKIVVLPPVSSSCELRSPLFEAEIGLPLKDAFNPGSSASRRHLGAGVAIGQSDARPKNLWAGESARNVGCVGLARTPNHRSLWPSANAIFYPLSAGNGELQWCFSQVKGTLDDDVTEGESRDTPEGWRRRRRTPPPPSRPPSWNPLISQTNSRGAWVVYIYLLFSLLQPTSYHASSSTALATCSPLETKGAEWSFSKGTPRWVETFPDFTCQPVRE